MYSFFLLFEVVVIFPAGASKYRSFLNALFIALKFDLQIGCFPKFVPARAELCTVLVHDKN